MPCYSKMRGHGCSLQDEGKFWDCRISLQFPKTQNILLVSSQWRKVAAVGSFNFDILKFPNCNFIRLGSLVVKCSVCCTGDRGLIPGPNTRDRQSWSRSYTGGMTLNSMVCPSHNRLKVYNESQTSLKMSLGRSVLPLSGSLSLLRKWPRFENNNNSSLRERTHSLPLCTAKSVKEPLWPSFI